MRRKIAAIVLGLALLGPAPGCTGVRQFLFGGPQYEATLPTQKLAEAQTNFIAVQRGINAFLETPEGRRLTPSVRLSLVNIQEAGTLAFLEAQRAVSRGDVDGFDAALDMGESVTRQLQGWLERR